ncbi:MAG: nuclear transport factor 2 family protein [Rhizobium sp.]|nr:nuclear transport factor 2 family protein [Rhizobium sp.]
MTDEQAVRDLAFLYVHAMAFGKEGELRAAFHPDAAIIGNYQNDLEWLSLDAFIGAIIAETPATPRSTPVCDVQSATVIGDTACVTVIDEFAGLRFTDILSMVKVAGNWKIVNKVYYINP